MAVTLRIPKAAVSMREGTLVAWLVPDGATVSEGHPLYTLELEKSTMDVESPAAGIIKQIAAAGVTYKVGDVIGEISTAPALLTQVAGSLQRIGQVVTDLDGAMRFWAQSAGAGPFVVFPHMALSNSEYRAHRPTLTSPWRWRFPATPW